MKLSPRRRKFQIIKNRHRKRKLRRLKEQYIAVKSSNEREKLLSKIHAVSPCLSIEGYLNTKR